MQYFSSSIDYLYGACFLRSHWSIFLQLAFTPGDVRVPYFLTEGLFLSILFREKLEKFQQPKNWFWPCRIMTCSFTLVTGVVCGPYYPMCSINLP